MKLHPRIFFARSITSLSMDTVVTHARTKATFFIFLIIKSKLPLPLLCISFFIFFCPIIFSADYFAIAAQQPESLHYMIFNSPPQYRSPIILIDCFRFTTRIQDLFHWPQQPGVPPPPLPPYFPLLRVANQYGCPSCARNMRKSRPRRAFGQAPAQPSTHLYIVSKIRRR